MGNGAVAYDGRTQLTYSIEHIKREDTLQENDIVALPDAVGLKSVFFSESGVSAVYSSLTAVAKCFFLRIQ